MCQLQVMKANLPGQVHHHHQQPGLETMLQEHRRADLLHWRCPYADGSWSGDRDQPTGSQQQASYDAAKNQRLLMFHFLVLLKTQMGSAATGYFYSILRLHLQVADIWTNRTVHLCVLRYMRQYRFELKLTAGVRSCSRLHPLVPACYTRGSPPLTPRDGNLHCRLQQAIPGCKVVHSVLQLAC